MSHFSSERSYILIFVKTVNVIELYELILETGSAILQLINLYGF
jgi:hypothetical protein